MNRNIYNAIDLAIYIINKCIDDKETINNLQLQAILYYIQKEYLQKYDRPIFYDVIEAWKFGPVVPNVFYKYCGFGATPISWELDKFNIEYEDKEIIDFIIESKRKLYPWQLFDKITSPNSPWDLIYNKEKGNEREIPIYLIK